MSRTAKPQFRPRVINPQKVAEAVARSNAVADSGDPIAPVQPPEALFHTPAAPSAKAAVAPASDARTTPVAVASSGWLVGFIYDVPLERIKPNPVNPRQFYPQPVVDAMAKSLRENGQDTPASGYVEGDHVVLIEGHTRQRASIQEGRATLRVEIKQRPKDERELYETARRANTEREDQTPLDDALCWKELLAKKVYPDQKSLAAALEIEESKVSRTMQLNTLPRTVLNVLREAPELHNLKMLDALRVFFRNKGEDDTIELIHEVDKKGLGAREVEARAKAPSRGETTRPRSEMRKFRLPGNATGELRVFEGQGRIEVSVQRLADPALVAKMRRALEQVLAADEVKAQP